MPTWAVYLIGTVAGLTALGVLWKGVKRIAKLITITDEMLPLLHTLVKAFKDTPRAFEILDEVVAQVRTDGGSSLLDAINRIEKAGQEAKEAARENRAASEVLKIGVEASKQLAQQDREQLQRLILLLDRLTIRVDTGVATGIRTEQRAIGVAQDLAESQRRAEEVDSGEAGAAADAAATSPTKQN